MDLWTAVDLGGTLLILLVLWGLWFFHFRTRPIKRLWRCYRWFGGGALTCPRPMTLEEATRWLAHDNNAEIGHVDEVHGFIFYRPRGGD